MPNPTLVLPDMAVTSDLLLVASVAFALVPNLRRARVPRPGTRYPA